MDEPQISNLHAVRNLEEIADAWHARSGQRLSDTRIWQIIKRAHEKIRAALEKGDI